MMLVMVWMGTDREILTIHPPGDLASLFIAPSDRRVVRRVVHEPTVKRRFLVRAGRLDVNLSKNNMRTWPEIDYQKFTNLATAGRVFLNFDTFKRQCENRWYDAYQILEPVLKKSGNKNFV
jgi:hypothetical protein